MTKLCKISFLLLMFGLHTALFADNGAQPKRLNRLLDRLSDQLKQKAMSPESAFATNTSPAIETKEPEIAILQANLARTGVYDEPGPEQLNELVWKFKANDNLSALVIYDRTIYVGCKDSHLYAINHETGRVKWKFKAGGAVNSPTVADGIAYFGCDDNYLYAVDIKTRKEKWKFKTNNKVRTNPIVNDGLVYFGSDDQHFYAANIRTGREKWKFKSEGPYSAYPAFYKDTIYVGSGVYLYAIDGKTGLEKWKFYTQNKKTGSPAIANDTIYFGGEGSFTETPVFYAVNLRTTQQKWGSNKLLGNSLESPPAIFNGSIFIGSRFLYCIDEQTGKKKWSTITEEENFNTTHGAVVTNNTVYFNSTNGTHIYALNISKGKENWRFKTEGNPKNSPYNTAHPLVFLNETAFFSSDEYLYAVK